MSDYVKKIVSVAVCAFITALFITVMHFAAPKIAVAKETGGEINYSVTDYLPDGSYISHDTTRKLGTDVAAVRICDLGKLNKLTRVNYVADKFITTRSLEGSQIVDLTKPFEFAEKGTLIFVIMNLDPESADFFEQTEKLAQYKIGDHWHFTISLPKIFNASNVYAQDALVARHGNIENYSFSDFNTNYDIKTENYSQKVERTNIDLQFYTRRQALNPYQMVTIHYQSSGTFYSGIADCPLIGTESAVGITTEISQNLLIAFAILSAVVCVVLTVLSVLKRTRNFINSIVWTLGITLMLFPRFMLGQVTMIPLFWAALTWSGVFFTLGGAILAIGRNFGKVPVKYIFAALMAVGGVLAFISPFTPFGAAIVIRTAFTVIKGVGAVALFFFAGVAVIDKNDGHFLLETVTIACIAVAVVASLFISVIFPVYINSMFWICVFATLITFVGVFKVFKDTETANAYLTANLHTEVVRQTKDIKAVISERDDLLRFVSHDMKKPLQFSYSLLDTLIEREKDEEQIKALKIIQQHTRRVIGNLSEIGSYARFNYIAEPSQIVDLHDLCQELCTFHIPDCNANGIILKNLVEKHYKVFIKKQGLENAVSNIILNAVEHSDGKIITISAKAENNRIILSVADDGKGIAEDFNPFKAYSSGEAAVAVADGYMQSDEHVQNNGNMKTNGVGLYICKNIVEAMSGELTYESDSNGTVFHISLLKS